MEDLKSIATYPTLHIKARSNAASRVSDWLMAAGGDDVTLGDLRILVGTAQSIAADSVSAAYAMGLRDGAEKREAPDEDNHE